LSPVKPVKVLVNNIAYKGSKGKGKEDSSVQKPRAQRIFTFKPKKSSKNDKGKKVQNSPKFKKFFIL
jgi:hypothetical protein